MDACFVVGVEATLNSNGVDAPAPSLTKPPTSARHACRVCGRTGLQRYLNFGLQPLANAYRAPERPLYAEFRAPLAVQVCYACKLSQLTHVVDPELLYANYAYRSGVSESWRRHCEGIASIAYGLGAKTALDIASNDGTLLDALQRRGCAVTGVEPSDSFGDVPNTVQTRWGTNTAQWLGETYDLITAQNVLGHVDDVHDFLAGIALALKPDGIALIEVPYILTSLFENCAFDTVYHEHLSYWSVTALQRAAQASSLVLRDVQHLAIHGGSIRATLTKTGKPSDAVKRALVTELHELTRLSYGRFSARVARAIARISEELLCQTPYVGFGAAAKTTVMLGVLDPRAYPSVVYDDNPTKQGKFVPGTVVPIEAPPRNWRTAPGPMCNFVWTQPDTVARLRAAGYDGAIYTPLPRGEWNEL